MSSYQVYINKLLDLKRKLENTLAYNLSDTYNTTMKQNIEIIDKIILKLSQYSGNDADILAEDVINTVINLAEKMLVNIEGENK